MNRLRRCKAILLLTALEALASPTVTLGYEGKIHQQLTFIAARQFNRCVESHPDIQRLSALDTRYIVRANVAQAEASVFVRMFRWSYYNRRDQSNKSSLGFIDTRFHDHFKNLVKNIERAKNRRARLRNLGRVLNYVQDVSSPPHAVPVYTGRWWRLSYGDRFDKYAVNAERTAQAIEASCTYVVSPPETYQAVLQDVASDTITSVQGQIFGFPTTWESYWKFARKDDEFGEYGPAGNSFGERTEFRCGAGERCLLLPNDPLYDDFAMDRHIAAVVATMRAMVLLQLREADDEALFVGKPVGAEEVTAEAEAARVIEDAIGNEAAIDNVADR